MNIRTKTGIAIGAAILTVGGAVGIGTLANASADSAGGTSQVGAPDGSRMHQDGMQQGGMQQGGVPTQLVQGLASKLGIDEATVQTAVAAAMQEVQSSGTASTSTDPREAMDAKLVPLLASKLGVDETKITTAMAELRSQSPMTGDHGGAAQAPTNA
jgi:hypothetical protein